MSGVRAVRVGDGRARGLMATARGLRGVCAEWAGDGGVREMSRGLRGITVRGGSEVETGVDA